VNDGGGSGASCGMDTTKLCNMVLGSFGDGQNLVGEGEMFIEDEAKVASRVSGVK